MVSDLGVLLTNVFQTSRGDIISFRLLGVDFLMASQASRGGVIKENDKVIGVSSEFVVSAPNGTKSLASIKAIFAEDNYVLYYLDHWVEC